jgi:hypothetical protein
MVCIGHDNGRYRCVVVMLRLGVVELIGEVMDLCGKARGATF